MNKAQKQTIDEAKNVVTFKQPEFKPYAEKHSVNDLIADYNNAATEIEPVFGKLTNFLERAIYGFYGSWFKAIKSAVQADDNLPGWVDWLKDNSQKVFGRAPSTVRDWIRRYEVYLKVKKDKPELSTVEAIEATNKKLAEPKKVTVAKKNRDWRVKIGGITDEPIYIKVALPDLENKVIGKVNQKDSGATIELIRRKVQKTK